MYEELYEKLPPVIEKQLQDGIKSMQKSSNVDHPPHYNSHPSGIECIQIAEHMPFNIGNAMKYLWRADEKGQPLEDLQKAIWYIQREIDRREAAK